MLTQMKDGQLVPTADKTAEQARTAADATTERIQDSIVQMVRLGLDVSLRSLQVWADLARQLGPTALRSPAAVAIVARTYDLFANLLAAQRQVVEELIATQRQFV